MRLLIVVCWALLAVECYTAIAAADETASAPAPMLARSRTGTTVAVQPLDDPRNPYLGQYQPWDRWIFATYQPGFDPAQYGGG